MSILPISSTSGEKSYWAIAGDKHSVGKTAGQSLDALTAQLGETEFSALLVIQSFHLDPFFSAEQQEQLSELMRLWRAAQDQGQELPPEQKTELDELVEVELRAATIRTATLMQPERATMEEKSWLITHRTGVADKKLYGVSDDWAIY